MPKMNIKTREARFYSRFRRLTIYPAGVPKSMIANNTVITVGAPVVMFENNRYQTEDQDLALEIVNCRAFNQEDGLYVDEATLPDEIMEFWSMMQATETRRAVVLALLEGKSVEDALALIDPDELDQMVEESDPYHANEVACPVPLCEFAARGKDAPGMVFAHLMATHPDYNPEAPLPAINVSNESDALQGFKKGVVKAPSASSQA